MEIHLPQNPDSRKPHIFKRSGMWMVYIFPGFNEIWLGHAKVFTNKKNNPQRVKQLDLRYNEHRNPL